MIEDGMLTQRATAAQVGERNIVYRGSLLLRYVRNSHRYLIYLESGPAAS